MSSYFIPSRPRRNRRSAALRDLVRETILTPADFILPLFFTEGEKTEVASMPDIYRHTLDSLLFEVEKAMELGIKAFDIFPVIEDARKDTHATLSTDPELAYLKCLRAVKERFPEAVVMTDVAMDPYSSDGHDGLVINGQIVNDETLPILAAMAVAQAQAGADLIGPSDMMDGRVGVIREALDEAGYSEVGILSYTAKYASGYYGPFRDALDSAPKFGDKKTYQMDPANRREAQREAALDEAEGADILMVKPALAYLDVIADLSAISELPIACYNVSGEYSMVHAAAQRGWLDADRIMEENLTAMKRAGASIILTYHAIQMAEVLKARR